MFSVLTMNLVHVLLLLSSKWTPAAAISTWIPLVPDVMPMPIHLAHCMTFDAATLVITCSVSFHGALTEGETAKFRFKLLSTCQNGVKFVFDDTNGFDVPQNFLNTNAEITVLMNGKVKFSPGPVPGNQSEKEAIADFQLQPLATDADTVLKVAVTLADPECSVKILEGVVLVRTDASDDIDGRMHKIFHDADEVAREKERIKAEAEAQDRENTIWMIVSAVISSLILLGGTIFNLWYYCKQDNYYLKLKEERQKEQAGKLNENDFAAYYKYIEGRYLRVQVDRLMETVNDRTPGEVNPFSSQVKRDEKGELAEFFTISDPAPGRCFQIPLQYFRADPQYPKLTEEQEDKLVQENYKKYQDMGPPRVLDFNVRDMILCDSVPEYLYKMGAIGAFRFEQMNTIMKTNCYPKKVLPLEMVFLAGDYKEAWMAFKVLRANARTWYKANGISFRKYEGFVESINAVDVPQIYSCWAFCKYCSRDWFVNRQVCEMQRIPLQMMIMVMLLSPKQKESMVFLWFKMSVSALLRRKTVWNCKEQVAYPMMTLLNYSFKNALPEPNVLIVKNLVNHLGRHEISEVGWVFE